ncbi:MAG: hypothetical protein AAF563_14850 [Pseudomonadota bacterium]
MPLQNRVTPFGEIVDHPARGLFLGNRGCLCDEAGKLATRRWRLRAWITCQLSYKGWWRPVMQPGVWTELFFMDEATALAAGHRPCALCRRDDYNRYRHAWALAQGLASPPKAVEMDDITHRERARRDRSKVTYQANLESLPDGAMVVLPGTANRAGLVYRGALLPWSPEGYGKGTAIEPLKVDVLTPASSVAVLAAGYSPVLHTSATL